MRRFQDNDHYWIGEKVDDEIVPYKLLEQISEGGFSLFFMADLMQSVRHRVGLNFTKSEMDTKQIIALQEAE